MLGRQQIAGVPTAISELFKNAHDAYADHAIVDFFRSKGLFVLRDDGVGMSRRDFEDRWLTLGTEGKSEGGGAIGAPAARPSYAVRPTLGEKGIGRLAIAAIGPQVLLLSRKLQDGRAGELTVAFINWGLFEIPSANLEDIEIPIWTSPEGELPSREKVGELVDRVERNLTQSAKSRDEGLVDRIRSELDSFRTIDPIVISSMLGSPDLATGTGTHFIIQPASVLLGQELDKDRRSIDASPLRRMLIGFANTMTPDHPKPEVRTSFRDHYTGDVAEDVIQDSEFFTPTEFAIADHHIRGQFDAHGQFRGEISVYGGTPDPYVVSWKDARGVPTGCGPFGLNLAYVQGRQRESRLPPDDFIAISTKLNRYGGLYIYRDNIRVLPYGNSDFDFLDIELQRAKSASDAFFSYRRIFGLVELTRRENARLREKAGREGFADNVAYRHFREILKHFFHQVAVDYFRETGGRSDRFVEERSELRRMDSARAKRKKNVRERRQKLSGQLDRFFKQIAEAAPELAVEDVLSSLDGVIASIGDGGGSSEAVDVIARGETAAIDAITKTAASYDIVRPRGVGLTKPQSRDWMVYEEERARLMEEVFARAKGEVGARVSEALSAFGADAARRQRFDSALSNAEAASRKSVMGTKRALDQESARVQQHAREIGKSLRKRFEGAVEEVLANAARLDLASLDADGFERERNCSVERIRDTATTAVSIMEGLVAQFGVIEQGDAEALQQSSYLDQVEAMETDLEALRDQSERDMELIQLGGAIAVINHEFDQTITAMRRSLSRIKSWADANPALNEPYRELRSSFEHLDSYLKLFTPLNRRLYRTRVEIAGAEVYAYVRQVFERRLEKQDISFEATTAFREVRVMHHPSVLYPTFVNIVDNAVFWLGDYKGERRIEFDSDGNMLIVRDTGPGVPTRDRDAIFEHGFSRKPGGSGLGLYISRTALQREGWSLELSPSSPDRGAEFVLGPLEEPS